jgi:NAD(P)-dependent dehydrogenase (short-subunit alcohol dehydrogenase family)
MENDCRILAGKVAIVTGAAAGIGEAVAHLFADQGAHVFILDLNRAAAVAEDIRTNGGSGFSFVADVRSPDGVRPALRKAQAAAETHPGILECWGDGERVGQSERGRDSARRSPFAPLSNLLLDELDRELERRGHRFVRYADDCNIYVRSERAG